MKSKYSKIRHRTRSGFKTVLKRFWVSDTVANTISRSVKKTWFETLTDTASKKRSRSPFASVALLCWVSDASAGTISRHAFKCGAEIRPSTASKKRSQSSFKSVAKRFWVEHRRARDLPAGLQHYAAETREPERSHDPKGTPHHEEQTYASTHGRCHTPQPARPSGPRPLHDSRGEGRRIPTKARSFLQ